MGKKNKSYLESLHDKLEVLQKRQKSNEKQLQLTHSSKSEFLELVSERNSISVDIATIKSRIENHNKPGIVPTIEIIR